MEDLSNLLFTETLDIDAASWLESNIYLPREVSPNAYGKLNLNNQPWMREILECVADPRIKEINLIFGAQTGKTTILLLSYMLLSRFYPKPCLIGLSTDPLAQRLVRRRLLPLLKSNTWWSEQLPPDNQGQESMILMPSMDTFYTGARTADKLASMAAGVLLLDEVSKWQKGSVKEAHPYLLVKERTKSFANYKIISSSTPSIKEEVFYQDYLHSSQSHYFMPCPHCKNKFEFIFSKDTVKWEQGNLETIKATAHYVCPHCGGVITNEMKHDLMQNGEWIKTRSNHDKGHLGFHLNSMYSPFVTFGDVACEFVKAQSSIIKSEALRNFSNSWEALPFVEVGQTTSTNDIKSIVDNSYFRGEVPQDALYIVLGGDAGQNQSHWLASAICADGSIKVIDWGTLQSYTSANGHYGYKALIDDLQFTDAKNNKWKIDIAYLDSGYSTNEIYEECLRGIYGQINPTKGSTHKGVWNETTVRTHADLPLFTYSDYSLKMSLHNLIKDKVIHLPADADNELIKGLEGQQVILTKTGQRQWKDLKEDHYNDCLKLCLFSTWINPIIKQA
jgi:YgiT-type zinc finger domain-containing protein